MGCGDARWRQLRLRLYLRGSREYNSPLLQATTRADPGFVPSLRSKERKKNPARKGEILVGNLRAGRDLS